MNWLQEVEELLDHELPPVLSRLCLDYLTVTIGSIAFVDEKPTAFDFQRHWFRIDLVDQHDWISLELALTRRYDEEFVSMDVVMSPDSKTTRTFCSSRIYRAELVDDGGRSKLKTIQGLLPCDMYRVENTDPNIDLPTGNVSWHATLHLFTDKGVLSVVCRNRHSGENAHKFRLKWFHSRATLWV